MFIIYALKFSTNLKNLSKYDDYYLPAGQGVVTLSVAPSLYWLLFELLSLLALVSQFTRVFGVNPQTFRFCIFVQPPELQLYCRGIALNIIILYKVKFSEALISNYMHNDKNSGQFIHSESHNDKLALKLIASKAQVNSTILNFCSLLKTFGTMSKQLPLLLSVCLHVYIYIYMINFSYASIHYLRL